MTAKGVHQAVEERLGLSLSLRGDSLYLDGDPVKLWNEWGAIIVRCRITERIMPGVVAVPQGAWWNPDKDGLDRGGNINVLTSERWTPFALGNAQHTIMVQAAKAKKAGRR